MRTSINGELAFYSSPLSQNYRSRISFCCNYDKKEKKRKMIKLANISSSKLRLWIVPITNFINEEWL
jgi:hypothetical protein